MSTNEQNQNESSDSQVSQKDNDKSRDSINLILSKGEEAIYTLIDSNNKEIKDTMETFKVTLENELKRFFSALEENNRGVSCINGYIQESEERIKDFIPKSINSADEQLILRIAEVCKEIISTMSSEIKSETTNSSKKIISAISSEIKSETAKSSKEIVSAISPDISDLKKSFTLGISSAKTDIENILQRDLSKINLTLSAINEHLLKENERLTHERIDLSRINGDLESTNKGLKENINSLSNQLTEKQQQIVESHQQYMLEKERSSRFEVDIQNKISELRDKTTKCDELEDEIEVLKKDIVSKTEELKNLNTDKQNITDELETVKTKYQKLNIDDNLLLAFNEFCLLQAETKKNLGPVFPGESFCSFIAAGLRLSNIAALWEMTKRNIFNDNLMDVEKLNNIFEILLMAYNEGSEEKQFELVIPTIGSQYDSSTSSIKEIKSSGTVSIVYLSGYKSTRDGTMHKAVISVND